MMNEYRIRITVGYESYETVIKADSYDDAAELAKIQYPNATGLSIQKIGDGDTDDFKSLVLMLLLIGGVLFFFSPAIVFYDLYTGKETSLYDKWGSVVLTTAGFFLTSLFVGGKKGLLVYLSVCLLSITGMAVFWYLYDWDFLGLF